MIINLLFLFFFFNDTATTEIYTLSLHYALPISQAIFLSGNLEEDIGGNHLIKNIKALLWSSRFLQCRDAAAWREQAQSRSEEHTSELQSRQYLVCRLLLEKKKN